MSLVPSIHVLREGSLTLHNEHGMPCALFINGLYVDEYLQNLDGRDLDIPYKIPYFFLTTEPNQMGFLPKYK